LEARFYPRQKAADSDFMVVGHVVWHGGRRRESPIVQPATAIALGETPASVLSKLQYLVTVTAKESFERLQKLESRFWSFVDVTPPLHEGGS
jgi:hypothetical protein